MQDIKIQKVSLRDIDQLQKICKETFSETFRESNSEQNMENYLEEAFSIEKLTREVVNPFSEFYFARLEDNIVGYLKINAAGAQTDLNDRKSMEIERIYVLKEFHGKNVGQLLYDKAIQIAKAKLLDYVWLGVWERNPRAIKFYSKNGFIEFDKHSFILGDEKQTDIMMKLQLDEKLEKAD